MTPNLTLSLDRAEELLREMLEEYEKSLSGKTVSPKAVHLTHEVCERLRSVLDRVARLYWETHVSPQLSFDDRKAASVIVAVRPGSTVSSFAE